MGGYYLPFYGNVRGSTKVLALTKEIEMKPKEVIDKVSENVGWIIEKGTAALGVYHLFGAFLGKQPPDDAPGPAKLAHGGLFSFDDEIAMFDIEQALPPEDKELIEGFRAWVRKGYGSGPIGMMLASLYKNRFRALVVRMRIPEKSVFDTHMEKKGDKDVPVKKERTEPADNTPAIKFLSTFAGEIREAQKNTCGGKRKKEEAGYRHAAEFLKDKSMPVPSFIGAVKPVDELLGKLPNEGLKMARGSGRKFSGWVDQEYDKIQEREEARTGFFGGLVRSLRKIL